MRLHPALTNGLGGIALLALTALATGCSSANTGASASTAPTATATACATRSFQAAVGTIQNITGTTFTIASQRGGTVQVTYTTATRFTREVTAPVSALQEGTPVQVAVSPNTSSTYAATRITITNLGNFRSATRGGFGAGNGRTSGGFGTNSGASGVRCFTRPSGTPGLAGTPGSRGLVGTVSQLTGNILTVTDFSGTDYTVTVTSATQIVQTSAANASALQTGTPVIVTGTRGNHNTLTARSVMILLALPGNGQFQL